MRLLLYFQVRTEPPGVIYNINYIWRLPVLPACMLGKPYFLDVGYISMISIARLNVGSTYHKVH